MPQPDIAPPAGGFKVDHIVIRTPVRDAVVAMAADACGLPELDGFAEGGDLHSRGVRFAGGPFLDVFTSDTPSVALILRGAMDEAEQLAAAQGWAARILRREETPQGQPAFPWSMVLFRRGQGLLTQISVIDYDPAPAAWASADFHRPLYPIQAPPQAGARLARVWMGAADMARAANDLEALGYRPTDAVRSAFWPHGGRRFQGLGTSLILFHGVDGLLRFDVTTGAGAARAIPLPGGPVMVVDEPALAG